VFKIGQQTFHCSYGGCYGNIADNKEWQNDEYSGEVLYL